MEVLGRKLYTKEELIKEVNESVKAPKGALNAPMLAYYRDIAGMIPKPLRIRTLTKRGGAMSYYTSEALDSLKIVVYENKINKKTLREIIKEKGEILDENIIRSDIFRNKYAYLIKTKSKLGQDKYVGTDLRISYMTENGKPVGKELREYLQKKLNDTTWALEHEVDEDKMDTLLDDLEVGYIRRIKYRMEEKARGGKKK